MQRSSILLDFEEKLAEIQTERKFVGKIAGALTASLLTLGGYLVFATVRGQAQIETLQRDVTGMAAHMDRIEDYLRNGKER